MYIPSDIILIVAIISIVALLLFRLSKREDYVKTWGYMISQSDYSYDFDQFRNNNRSYNERQAIKHFLAKKGKQTIIDSYNEHVNFKEKMNDMYKKRQVKARVFSYQYEDFVFSLFSEIAEKRFGEWDLPLVSYIPEEKVLAHIQKYYNVDNKAAHDILKVLVDNDMLDNHLYGDRYDMGSVLKYHPNIISDSDMNFSKWMNTHINDVDNST